MAFQVYRFTLSESLLFLAGLLWSRRHHLDETDVDHRYGFLYEMYRRETYWWGRQHVDVLWVRVT